MRHTYTIKRKRIIGWSDSPNEGKVLVYVISNCGNYIHEYERKLRKSGMFQLNFRDWDVEELPKITTEYIESISRSSYGFRR